MRFFSTLLASTIGTLIAAMLILFLGFLFVLGIAASADTEPTVSEGSTLVLEIDGPIPERTSPDPFAEAFGESPSPDVTDIQRALRMAAVDERIDGVLLRIKGGSAAFGSWAPLSEVRRALIDFKESGKPLYATSGEFGMTQGSYFLASTADSVFAQPQSQFVFNGLNYVSAFFANTLEMLNVNAEVIRAGRYKSAVEPFTREDMSAANEEQMQALMQTTYEIFVSAIAESRGIPEDSLRMIATEDGMIGAEAAEAAGLLDGLRYDDEVQRLFPYDTSDTHFDFDAIDLAQYSQLSASSAGLETGNEGSVAVVYALGQIVPGESDTDPFTQQPTALGSTDFERAMRDARDNDNVDAVVVRINSPGGSASASEAIRRSIALTRDVKPVIVSMSGLAASGGYWMATSSDSIVADPTTLTGSIGVFGLFLDARGFFNEELGVTFDAVQTSPFADLGSAIGEFSNEERQLLQNWVDDTYQTFLEHVASNRDLTVTEVDSLAQGRVWTGERAHELGLVDVLGGLPEAISIAAESAGLEEDTYSVRYLPRTKTFMEQFFSGMGSRAGQIWLKMRTTPAERRFLERTMEQTRMLRNVAGQSGTVQALMPMTVTIE